MGSDKYIKFNTTPTVNSSGTCTIETINRDNDGYQSLYLNDNNQSTTFRPDATYRLYIHVNGNQYTWELVQY